MQNNGLRSFKMNGVYFLLILFMPSHCLINIACLAGTGAGDKVLRGKDLAALPVLRNAYLIVEDGIIAEYGEMRRFELGRGDLYYPAGAIPTPILFSLRVGKRNLSIRSGD
jgi:hypothetical protein